VEISCRVYKPRRARESPLFRLVQQHLEELLRVWPTRFARQHGPLRPVVERVLRGFMRCGLVEHGFARLWCPTCRTSVLCPFSCRGRSFCPSCEKKRQLLWAEWLQKEVLAPVPHRHLVLTMPRLLRGIFRKRRELLLDLSQCAAEAVAEYVRTRLGPDCRPGIVVSVATAGDLVQWHPHGHLLLTDGAFSNDGAFHALENWDAEAVMKLFRERLLARLVERHATSEDLARKLVAWRHPGFSSHLADPIPFESKKAIEDLACYLVRAPLSLQKLVYLDGRQAVLYRSRMNPSLGRNFEAMDPLEWLARLADHIPDPGRHRTHFYAHYANRVRGERPDEEAGRHADDPEPTTRRRSSPSWARLLAKVFQVDPLVCRRCAGPLKVVAYITDSLAIRQILEHLGLSPPEKPPPDIREVVRVPVDEQGREIEAQPA
jgi:Transposase zinc-binding domain/Putative transposase